MKTDLEFLVEALKKQRELLKINYWASELLELSPPVLWFGNSENKDKVATVGANPSRREFLDGRDGQYLRGPKQRFYHLKTNDIQEVLEDERTLRLIVDSYNRYFHQNPYMAWFGRPGGSKVEGFLNALGASLYGTEPIGAVHTDLIPFATMNNFSKLNKSRLKRDFFECGWASNFFDKLIKYLNPSTIIVFGKRNAKYFDEYYQRIVLNKSFIVNEKQSVKYGISYYDLGHKTIPLVGLSLYLGDPYGFTKEMLSAFGAFIRSKINNLERS